jgi:uncharacterized protein YggU (UPF0235/DUF167 family)
MLTVRVVPGAKHAAVSEKDGVFYIRTTAKAADGKANEAVVKLLAEHFGVSKSSIRIVRGHTARTKLVEVLR